jgi:hypothetical protein
VLHLKPENGEILLRHLLEDDFDEVHDAEPAY